jgi:dihydroorotase
MTFGGHLHEGRESDRHNLRGLPAAAEEQIIERDILLSSNTGCRLHIQHLSSAGSVELVRKAKASGMNLTCEVTPHHLAFDDRALETLDTNLKMYPPVRGPEDRAALVAALRDGTIDAVATDHAPHSPEEKDVPFPEAPRGVVGLETAAPVAYEALEGDLEAFFDRMSSAPAGIAGLAGHGRPVTPGESANLVLWSPNQSWVATGFESKSSNSPFLGKMLRGRVVATVHEGDLVYREGTVNA